MVSAETVLSVPVMQFQGIRDGQRCGRHPPPPTTAGAGRVSRGPGCLTQTSQGLTEKEGASGRLQEWGLGLWEPSVEVAGCEGKLQVET